MELKRQSLLTGYTEIVTLEFLSVTFWIFEGV